MNKSIAAVVLLCMMALTTQAQQPVRLADALDSAARNNYTLQAAASEVAYFKTLRKTGWDLDKTTLLGEYGSYNSLAKDNRFAISQSVQFPTVYTRQKQVLNLSAAISETGLAQKKIEVRTRIKQVFSQLLVLQQKRKLLLETDSIYSHVLDKYKQRFRLGDVDAIEMSSAENQRWQIATQLQSLETDYEVLLTQLRVLMNARTAVAPVSDSVAYHPLRLPASATDAENPYIRAFQQRLALSEKERKLESARLLPSLSAGYNNTSIKGWQRSSMDPEQYFDYSKRFTSVNMGVGIPLFYGAQKARINAAARAIDQRQLELTAATQELSAALQNAVKTYTQRKAAVATYRTTLLPNAATVITSANSKLALGEISYLNWAILINQAVSVRNEYFDMIEQMNEAAIEIERLSAIN